MNSSAAFLPYLNHLSSVSLPVKIQSPLKPGKKKKKKKYCVPKHIVHRLGPLREEKRQNDIKKARWTSI